MVGSKVFKGKLLVVLVKYFHGYNSRILARQILYILTVNCTTFLGGV